MNGNLYPSTSLWPLGLFIGCAIAVAAAMIGLSYLLGERHWGRATGEPYESGMPPAVGPGPVSA